MPPHTQHTRAGTPAYMAPEVIQQSYNCNADVWSAGIMMYQLLTGKSLLSFNLSFSRFCLIFCL